MTECKKALNSTVSTLKKNPDRVARLAKMAGFRIVPPSHYATGATRKSLEDAVSKLKGKRGLNGVVGEGTGPFAKSDSLPKQATLMKAAGAKADTAATAAGAGLGAAAGYKIGKATQHAKQDLRVDMRSLSAGSRRFAKDGDHFKKSWAGEKFRRRAAHTVETATKNGARRGGLVGAAAGGLAALAAKRSLEKKAMDKKTKDRALAASAVTSGAALGGVLTHDKAKANVKTRHAIKENARAAKYTNGAERAVGFTRRLARSARVDRNMVKPLRRAGIKGAVAGGLVGAALGAAHLKKEASDNRHAVTAGAVAGGTAAGMAVGRKIGRQKATERENVKKVLRTHKLRHAVREKHTVKRDFDRFLKDRDAVRNARYSGAQSSHNMSTAHILTRHNAEKAIARGTKRGGVKGALAGAAIGAGIGAAAHMKKQAGLGAAYMNKEAGEKTRHAAAAAGGALVGATLASDSQAKKQIDKVGNRSLKQYKGKANFMAGMKASEKFQRRAADTIKNARRKGGKIGALAGAAAGLAASAAVGHKKEAGVLNSRTLKQRAASALAEAGKKARGMMPVNGELSDRTKRALKTGAVAGAIGAGGVAVTRKNEELKKQASELVIKDGKKYRKGTVTSAATKMGVAGGTLAAIAGKDWKRVGRTALHSSMVGGAYGTVRGANRLRKGEISLSAKEMKKTRHEALTKKAAELLYHNGEAIRRGTIGSAAGKMAVIGATLGGLGGMAAGPAGVLAGAALGAGQAAITGGLYGVIRGALRAQDGEKSMSPHAFDALKAKHA